LNSPLDDRIVNSQMIKTLGVYLYIGWLFVWILVGVVFTFYINVFIFKFTFHLVQDEKLN